MLAAGRGEAQIVTDLLAAGADPAQRDGQGKTALHAAARSCDEATVAALLLKPFAVSPDDQGQTPLHAAVEACKDAGFVEHFIAGADINAVDGHGRTPLWYAVAAGKVSIAEHLLTRGARPNIADDQGLTPLHVAAAAGDSDLVKHLIDGEADRGLVTLSGNSVLMFAAASKCAACVVMLPQPRDTIDQQNKFGDTALIVATRAMQPDIARLLVVAGTDPKTRNNRRDTALKIATRLNDRQLIAAVSDR